MADLAAEHGIVELVCEIGRGAHRALRRERAAEHQRAFGERAVVGELRDQFLGVEHRRDRAGLVDHAFAFFHDGGAQQQPVPMRRDGRVIPEIRRDRLVAHLLRHGDRIRLDLPIGVVGAGADPEPAGMLQQHELDFAARGLAEAFDLVVQRQPRRRRAVEHRRGRRALDAQCGQFLDVLLDRRLVAAGPAGDHQAIHLDADGDPVGLAVQNERKNTRRHDTSETADETLAEPREPTGLRPLCRRRSARCNGWERIVHGVKIRANTRQSRSRRAQRNAAGCDLFRRRLALRSPAMHEITGQTHWHEPSGFKRAGFGKFNRPKTPYDLFMESEDIPVYRDIGVSKVQNLPLKPWKRMGGRGTYIQLHGTEGKWGCYVVEVPGAGALNPEKHMYEEVYLVVEGRGSTEVWLDGDSKRHVFEWQKGSLFSIPVNAMHRIVNASSSPALLLGGTTAPNILNLLN